MWPRGHGKSEQTSINYVSWMLGNHPDININIVSKTASLSESILTAIMTRVESDERYLEVFGDLKPKRPSKWTAQQLIIKRPEKSKNASLKATGLMGAITGGRSDLIVCDDIIDEENIRSPLQLEKVDTWFNKVLFPTLYPQGGIIVIGTRWSYADIYSKLLEKWPHSVLQAIQPDGSALWPDYWDLASLEKRRDEMGSVFFAAQYMNDPSGMEGSLLKSEWLRPYQSLPSGLVYYAGVDPALGSGDQQAIATIGVDRATHQTYLIDVWSKTVGFPEFLQKIRRMNEAFGYTKLYFEGNAFQKVLMYLSELRGLPIVSSNTGKDKETRFISMSSHFESGRTLVNPTLIGGGSEFWNQWVQFPRGVHDDAVDSVEIAVRNVVAKPKGFILF